MRLIIGRSLTPLNYPKTLRAVRQRETVGRSDDNSRGELENVRGGSSADHRGTDQRSESHCPDGESKRDHRAMGKNWSSSVTGSSNDYFTAGNWTLASGRVFTEAEERSGAAVCVVGETVRNKLFGQENPVGSAIRVKQFSCDVIGLLKSNGQASMGRDQDDTVIVPLKTLQRRVSGSQDISSLMVAAADGASTERIKASVEQLMRERRHVGEGEEDNFNVLDTKEIAQTMTGATRMLTMLLGAVAAVRARARTSCSEALIRVR